MKQIINIADLEKINQQACYSLMYKSASLIKPEGSLFDTLSFDEQVYEHENCEKDFTYYENGNVEYEDILIDIDEDGIVDFEKFTLYDEEGNIKFIRNTTYNEQGNAKQKESIYYDEQGNVAYKNKSLFFYIDTNNDGETEIINEFSYDEQGNVETISNTTFNKDGSRNSKNVSYDEQGNVETVMHSTRNEDGSENCERIFYNEQGNTYYKIETIYENGKITEEKIIEDENLDGISDIEITNTYNSNGEIVNSEFNYNFEGDETIGASRQNAIGDCWLLAGLNALSNTSDGKKIIENAISINDDGSYSVYFKGIDSTYTITEEEIIEAKSKDIYSRGDVDMLVMELAFEKVFNDGNNITTGIKELDEDLHNLDKDEKHVLDGGWFSYVTYLLTGRNTASFENANIINFINPETTPTLISFKSGTVIEDIEGNEILLCGGVDSAHAWSLKSIDGNIATIINPHDSSTEIKVNLNDLTNTINNGVEILDLEFYFQ